MKGQKRIKASIIFVKSNTNANHQTFKSVHYILCTPATFCHSNFQHDTSSARKTIDYAFSRLFVVSPELHIRIQVIPPADDGRKWFSIHIFRIMKLRVNTYYKFVDFLSEQ